MSYNINQEEINLLYHNPKQLLIRYQYLIDHIIHLFIRSGNLKTHEISEIKQQVNEELMNRLPKMQAQYQGKSLLKTYASVVIRNICNEIVRSEAKIKFIYLKEKTIVDEDSCDPLDALILKDEMHRLRKALRLYDEHEAKLTLCLKLKFKIPFDIKDFQLMFEGFSHIDFIAFTQEIEPYNDASDLTVLTALTRIFNKYQNKNNTPDALRKWIMVKITEVIELLNGNPPTYFYTMETLQILFEKCFCSEKDVVSKIY